MLVLRWAASCRRGARVCQGPLLRERLRAQRLLLLRQGAVGGRKRLVQHRACTARRGWLYSHLLLLLW